MLEFAVSLVGLVSLIVISLNVWHWMGRMLVERQGSFQSTRKEAGSTHPGERVPYHRPPIVLFKSPASLDGDGAPNENPLIPDHLCPAGEALLDQAKTLLQQADVLQKSATQEAATAERKGRAAETLTKELNNTCGPNDKNCVNSNCGPDDENCIKFFTDIIKTKANEARHHAKLAQDDADLASAKTDEAMTKVSEGEALCNPPDPSPSTN